MILILYFFLITGTLPDRAITDEDDVEDEVQFSDGMILYSWKKKLFCLSSLVSKLYEESPWRPSATRLAMP